MKFFPSELFTIFSTTREKDLRVIFRFLLFLTGMIAVYSVVFHFLMEAEGKSYSWITGVYWTLTVMSTLGFGDITFTSDIGKLFSLFVLITGVVFLLILLPFTFIQFFYAPWLEAREKTRAPRDLADGTTGHVILTSFDATTQLLIERLKQFRSDYVVIIPDPHQAVELHDRGIRVAVGEVGDHETYLRLRADMAAMVVANVDDMTNTNIAFTIRETCPEVPIVSNAESEDSVDILQLAGSNHVFQFKRMLGQSLARRTLGAGSGSNIIGSIETMHIAEAPAMRSVLEGMTLAESMIREKTGINVVGLWERGVFQTPTAETRIRASTVLILAGSAEQLRQYDERYGGRHVYDAPVLILGGGRVGRAAAKVFKERGLTNRIIEKDHSIITGDNDYVEGSAADIKTLKKAGIDDAPAVLITTHDDAMNIYLTIYCRRLRPDIQIISRANVNRNVSKLHTAGADLVMSYDSILANVIVGLLKPGRLLMLSEGLNVFRVPVHESLIGRTLAESQIRERTGCSIISVLDSLGQNAISPGPEYTFRSKDELVVIGTDEAENQLIEIFRNATNGE